MVPAEFWSTIQDKICRRCIDGDGFGACRLPAGESCALQHYLPQIISCVNERRSDRIDDYIARLRTSVCAQCASQDAALVCTKRNHLECALDRYYPLVVEIIESVRQDAPSVSAA